MYLLTLTFLVHMFIETYKSSHSFVLVYNLQTADIFMLALCKVMLCFHTVQGVLTLIWVDVYLLIDDSAMIYSLKLYFLQKCTMFLMFLVFSENRLAFFPLNYYSFVSYHCITFPGKKTIFIKAMLGMCLFKVLSI